MEEQLQGDTRHRAEELSSGFYDNIATVKREEKKEKPTREVKVITANQTDQELTPKSENKTPYSITRIIESDKKTPAASTDFTNWFLNQYPEMADELHMLYEELFQVTSSKMHDYGPNNISMGGNVNESLEDRLFALTGLITRMNDKMQRLLNLVRTRRDPGNESLSDTFTDIANYALFGRVLMDKKWGK